MGCGQKAWEDDEIELHHRKMRILFEERGEPSRVLIEAQVAVLFECLEKQQLTQHTFKLMNQLRDYLTSNTPSDNKIYVQQGYWYKGV